MLSSHNNVYNSCLLILRHGGWLLSVEGECDQQGSYVPESLSWTAEKSAYRLRADNPIELLGLATIYDYKQPTGEPEPYWWSVNGPDLYDQLIDVAFPDEDMPPAPGSRHA